MKTDIINLLKRCEKRLSSDLDHLARDLRRANSNFPIPVSALQFNKHQIELLKTSSIEGKELRNDIIKLIKELDKDGKCNKGCFCGIPKKSKFKNNN